MLQEDHLLGFVDWSLKDAIKTGGVAQQSILFVSWMPKTSKTVVKLSMKLPVEVWDNFFKGGVVEHCRLFTNVNGAGRRLMRENVTKGGFLRFAYLHATATSCSPE